MHTLKEFENGFEYIEVKNSVASAKIALQGAHIFEYSKNNKSNLLWLSSKSAFESGVAIRGGVPLCWPRFGSLDESLAQHGFARTMFFTLVGVKDISETKTEVKLQLKDTPQTRALWDHHFILDVTMVITENLEISISTKNLDEKDLFITQALHTYFAVSNIKNVVIKGLENKFYFDTLLDERHKESKSITIDKEIDRVYLDTDEETLMIDREREVKLKTTGSASTIVWNPWNEKCSKMSHMSKDAYKEFVCIESANAFDDFVLIKSKKSHTLKVIISF